tara:strand:+ start:211 stop:942 length:732 start_codon:yes stop_codon:yes gene_type:complete
MGSAHCFCDGFLPHAKAATQHSLLLYAASKELAAHASSNTGKLVLMWGGELVCEGVDADEARLDAWLRDAKRPVVLFPSSDATVASRTEGHALLQGVGCGDGPLSIVVLDASWRGARRMNARINASIPRVCLADVERASELRTRKRVGDDIARVQTAPALVQFLRECGEDTTALDAGLDRAIAAYAESNCYYAKKFDLGNLSGGGRVATGAEEEEGAAALGEGGRAEEKEERVAVGEEEERCG